MQTLNIIIVILLFTQSLVGQYASHPWFYFEVGDTLTVVAASGLNLRDTSSAESNKVGVIPFGGKIIALGNYDGIEEEFGNRKGNWLKVKYENLVGYVFSGFVTNLKVPAFALEEDPNINDLVWFEKFARTNVDTLACKGERLYKGFDEDGKDWHKSLWEIFTDETEIYHSFGYESEDLIIESTEINMNDVLNLLEYCIGQIQKTKPDEHSLEEGRSLQIDVKKDSQGNVKTIECTRLNFFAENNFHKTTIRVNLIDL